jgi:hypothetical protein
MQMLILAVITMPLFQAFDWASQILDRGLSKKLFKRSRSGNRFIA